jgi:type IV secretion system protein VirB8
MSDDNIRKQYDAEVGSTIKTSPYQMYGKNKSVIVNVLSVSRLNENTASIRFDKVLHDHESGMQQVSHNVAIIKWKYVKEPATQKALDRNPLGFKVFYYQLTQVNSD